MKKGCKKYQDEFNDTWYVRIHKAVQATQENRETDINTVEKHILRQLGNKIHDSRNTSVLLF